MIYAVESKHVGDSRFRVSIEADGEEASAVLRELTARMIGQVKAEQHRDADRKALSATDLRNVIDVHERTAAVRDCHDTLWRWDSGVSNWYGRPNGQGKSYQSSESLVRDFGPITEVRS